MKDAINTELKRRDLVKELVKDRDANTLMLAGLGSPCWDLTNAGDVPENFYIWGAMGGAAMVGFGVARQQPDKRVVVLTGDGEMLMGMGAFATIANHPVRNLAIVVLDNGRFGETGGQKTHTSAGVTDLAGIARASGIPTTATITKTSEIDQLKELALRTPGPVVVVAKVQHEKLKFVLPANSGSYLKDRFRNAILGEERAQK
jgi:thiamine pyrophosphate-dependent acetolactate synthase large subunit-like protein